MADNDNQLPLMPPCSKCGRVTTSYRRVPDPEKGIIYELFDCAVCGLTTIRRTPQK